MNNETQSINRQYLSDKAIANRYGLSRSSIWRWLHEGKLPQPIKINGSTRWLLSDLEAFEKQCGGSDK